MKKASLLIKNSSVFEFKKMKIDFEQNGHAFWTFLDIFDLFGHAFVDFFDLF